MAEDANDERAKLLKINDLADLLSYHSNKYYNEASPEISDSEFDSLRDELESLDPNHHNFPEWGQTSSRIGKNSSRVPNEKLG